MAIKHVMTYEYIGSDAVSWTTAEDGVTYIINAMQLHGTSDEEEIVRREVERKTIYNIETEELISETQIKRVIEFSDESAKNSAYTSKISGGGSSLFKKCDIKFSESFIDTEDIKIIEAEITCEGQAEGRPDAKLPWETFEEAKDYIINIINTYASDTDNTYFKDIVVPILDDSERTTLELQDVTDHPDSGPGSLPSRPAGFSDDVWNYIFTGKVPVFEISEEKTEFSLKVAEELTKYNMSDPADYIKTNSSLTGSNKLKVSIKFSSQNEYDTYIQQFEAKPLSTIKTMLKDLGIEVKIL